MRLRFNNWALVLNPMAGSIFMIVEFTGGERVDVLLDHGNFKII